MTLESNLFHKIDRKDIICPFDRDILPAMKHCRIQIRSCSEAVSAEFAFVLLPFLERFLGKQIRLLQFTEEAYRSDCPFIDVESLDWISAPDQLRHFANEGHNLLILSEKFWNWGAAFDSEGFEAELEKSAVSVLIIGAYSEEPSWEGFSVHKWYEADIPHVLEQVLDGHARSPLLSPDGTLPCFLLDPEQTDLEESHVKVLSGFHGGTVPITLALQPLTPTRKVKK